MMDTETLVYVGHPATVDRSEYRAINPAGHVLGRAKTASGAQQAFLYSGHTMTDLGALLAARGYPFADRSTANALNDKGQVLLNSAFLYDGTDIEAVRDLIAPGSEFLFEGATAINNLGHIGGVAVHP